MSRKLFLGLDLGQSRDHSAIVIVERVEPPFYTRAWAHTEYHVRHIERPTLGTRYPAVVERVVEIREWLESDALTVVVDATGVGRPVVDLFHRTGLRPIGVTITGGDSVSGDGSDYRVPKRDLTTTLELLLDTKQLKIAHGLSDKQTLIDELLAFHASISETGRDSYGATGRAHDDLVIATALACWCAQDNLHATVAVPPVRGISEVFKPDPADDPFDDGRSWVLGPASLSLPLQPYAGLGRGTIPGARSAPMSTSADPARRGRAQVIPNGSTSSLRSFWGSLWR